MVDRKPVLKSNTAVFGRLDVLTWLQLVQDAFRDAIDSIEVEQRLTIKP